MRLALRRAGAGPPVLLVHGMAAERRATGAPLADGARRAGARGRLRPPRLRRQRRARALRAHDGPRAGRGRRGAGAARSTRRRPWSSAPTSARSSRSTCCAATRALLRARRARRPAGCSCSSPRRPRRWPRERLALEEALRDGGPGRAVEVYLGWQGAGAERARGARARAPGPSSPTTAGSPRCRSRAATCARCRSTVTVIDGATARSHQRAASNALAPHAAARAPRRRGSRSPRCLPFWPDGRGGA